jgi:hypothetical protein
VGVVGFSGAALAEFKVGGDIVNTINFVSADAAGAANSGQRTGSEMNLKLSGSADLSNGWKAIYGSKWEMDGPEASNPDHEYELKLQSGDLYVAINNDYGQSNAQWSTPYISYPASSVASQAATMTFGADDKLSTVRTSESIGFGGKVGNGSAVVRYAFATGAVNGNDITTVNAENSASTHQGYLVAWKGDLGGGLSANAAYTKVARADSNIAGQDDLTEKRIGVAYKMGKVTVGTDQIRYRAGADTSNTGDANISTYGVSFAVNDQVSAGLYYNHTTDESTSATKQDENVKMLSVGYNLGPASISVNYAQIEGAANATTGTNADYDVVQIATKVAF